MVVFLVFSIEVMHSRRDTAAALCCRRFADVEVTGGVDAGVTRGMYPRMGKGLLKYFVTSLDRASRKRRLDLSRFSWNPISIDSSFPIVAQDKVPAVQDKQPKAICL